MNDKYITNGKIAVCLANTDLLPEITGPLLDFLNPYFKVCPPVKEHFRVNFFPFSQIPGVWKENAVEKCVIRASTARLFNLEGRRLQLSDHELVVIDDENKTAFRFDSFKNAADLFISERSFIHLIEFIRYTVLLLEESCGTVLLHASAASMGDDLFIICGGKGSGKTTALLGLIDSGMDYFSGDKVLVSSEGRNMTFRGWPDYPHIGIGSLEQFPSIAGGFGASLVDSAGKKRNPQEKELISPAIFRKVIKFSDSIYSHARAILFPQVLSEKRFVRVIPEEEKSAEKIKEYIEFPGSFSAVKWHNLFDRLKGGQPDTPYDILSGLCKIPWINVSGPVKLSYSVFKELI